MKKNTLLLGLLLRLPIFRVRVMPTPSGKNTCLYATLIWVGGLVVAHYAPMPPSVLKQRPVSIAIIWWARLRPGLGFHGPRPPIASSVCRQRKEEQYGMLRNSFGCLSWLPFMQAEDLQHNPSCSMVWMSSNNLKPANPKPPACACGEIRELLKTLRHEIEGQQDDAGSPSSRMGDADASPRSVNHSTLAMRLQSDIRLLKKFIQAFNRSLSVKESRLQCCGAPETQESAREHRVSGAHSASEPVDWGFGFVYIHHPDSENWPWFDGGDEVDLPSSEEKAPGVLSFEWLRKLGRKLLVPPAD